MKKVISFCVAVTLAMCVTSFASTVAHWDFNTEGMTDGDFVLGNADTAGSYNYSVEDLSGNNNHLCGWTDTWMQYSSDTYSGTGLSITSTNSWPDARTDNDDNPYTIGTNAETITPSAWTVEALFKSGDLGGNRTIVGRDGYHVGGNTSSAAALYLSTRGTELAIDYTDVTGVGHCVQVAIGLTTDTWYNVAAVSDGTYLTLYLDGSAIGSLDMTGSSADTALGLGETNGAWTVCCGQWNQGAVDRFVGSVDEVAISDAALDPSSFVIPEPATLILLAAGAVLTRRKK